MPTIDFDGPNRIITIGHDGPVTTVTVADIYSRWKEWLIDGNAQYVEAFASSIGGDDLGGGVSLTGYFFLRNDLGWRITHAEFDYQINMVGDLYPSDPATPFVIPTLDPFTVSFIFQRSASSFISVSDQSGLTPTESSALTLIEKLLRNRRETDPVTGQQRIYDDDNVTVLVEGDLWEDIAATQPYQGQGADRADRLDD